MNGIGVLAFFLGACSGYLLALWVSKRTLESLYEQLEETQRALLAERKRVFTPEWQRLRVSDSQRAVQ